MTKKIIFNSLRVLTGLLFIASGLLKLYPIEPFELNFIDLGIGNWYTAPFIARLLIATELFLGLLLVVNIRLKQFTLKATAALLIFFTVYLFIQILHEGNNGNCGCFGTYLTMTPLESIVKNFVLLAVIFILLRFHPHQSYRYSNYLLIFALISSLVLPFVLNPVDLMAAGKRNPEAANFAFDHSLIENDSSYQKSGIDLSKGKHIVAFLSMTCEHCKALAFKLHVMEKRHPEIPFFVVLNGKEKDLPSFFDETKADNIPFIVLHGMPFAKITGGSVPVVYWIKDGIVERKSLYISLEEDEILKWLDD